MANIYDTEMQKQLTARGVFALEHLVGALLQLDSIQYDHNEYCPICKTTAVAKPKVALAFKK